MIDWIMNMLWFCPHVFVCIHCLLHMHEGANFAQVAFTLCPDDFILVARIYWVVGSMEVAIRLDKFYLVDRLMLKTKWFQFVVIAAIDFCLIIRHRRNCVACGRSATDL